MTPVQCCECPIVLIKGILQAVIIRTYQQWHWLLRSLMVKEENEGSRLEQSCQVD